MRIIVFLSALLICGSLTAAKAAPASIAGSWSGSGTVGYRGSVDRVYCRAHFTKTSAKSFALSSVCTTAKGSYDIVGSVTSTGGGRYRGTVISANVRGRVDSVLWRKAYVGKCIEPARLRADHAFAALDPSRLTFARPARPSPR